MGTIRVKVTEDGVAIPKKLLRGVKEVEIRKGPDVILVVPTVMEDPIFGLGSNPVTCGASDASENLDLYLYAANE